MLLQSFGLVNYYHHLIPQAASILWPLHQMVSHRCPLALLVWSDETNRASLFAKNALSIACILYHWWYDAPWSSSLPWTSELKQCSSWKVSGIHWSSSPTHFVLTNTSASCLTWSCLPPMPQAGTSSQALRGVGDAFSPIITPFLRLFGMSLTLSLLGSSTIFLCWQYILWTCCTFVCHAMLQLMPFHGNLSVESSWV